MDASAQETIVADLAAGTVVGSAQDSSVMDKAEGPMKLKITGSFPETGLVYSKSFLGNGMNRMTVAALELAVHDGNSEHCKRRLPNPSAPGPCIDFPCWQEGSIVQWPAGAEAPSWFFGGPDPKVIQDLSTSDAIKDFLKPAWTDNLYKPPRGYIFGTNDHAHCLDLVRRVWKGKDDHLPHYPYKQQMLEVRAALNVANKNNAFKKKFVVLSTKTIAFNPRKSNDHPAALKAEPFRHYLRHVYTQRPLSQFTYHTPLVAAYYESILFDAPDAAGFGAFNLKHFCGEADCKYGAFDISWTDGAADLFAGMKRVRPDSADIKAQYLAWKFHADAHYQPGATHPDFEDPYTSICGEDTPFAGAAMHRSIDLCASRKHGSGRACALQIRSLDNTRWNAAVKLAPNQRCAAWTNAGTTMVAGVCRCQ
jgi:hypothetical protein